MPANKKTTKQIPGGARKRKGGYPCPDCEFIAKHAMGLGRHRSTRHGVVSKRQQRRATATPAAWLTREQAAARAGVHYNTIRQWEQSGLLRMTKRPRVRGALVSVADLDRVLADRSHSAGGASTAPAAMGVDAAAVADLERRFSQLVEGLEALVASVKGGPRARRASSTGAKRATGKRTRTAATKTGRGTKKRKAAKPARKATAASRKATSKTGRKKTARGKRARRR